MLTIQLIWMFASFQPLKLTQLANMFLLPDAELDVPLEEPDSHHAPPLKKDEVERVVVKGLLNMSGDLAGAYFPLAGSRSYAAMPGGMTEAKENSLRSRGNLFQEPDSTLLLSSGCGRHWPDARGIFHNHDENLFVWVNEEDQMRIVSMEKGDNVKRIIERFAKATSTI